jgi:hypothetical protein
MPPGMRYAPTCDKVTNTLLYCGVLPHKAKALGSVLALKGIGHTILQRLVVSGIKLAIVYGGTILSNLTCHTTVTRKSAALIYLLMSQWS